MMAFTMNLSLLLLLLILHSGDQKKLEVVQPSFIKATAGDSVTIPCFFKTDSPYFTVKWTLCCNPLESFLEHERYKDRITVRNNSLEVTIVNVTEKDSEKYCCRIQTADGEVGVGNGTLLNVSPHIKEVMEEDADKNQAQVFLFTIIVLETCITFILLAAHVKYRISGSSVQKNKPRVEPEPFEEICYTEVSITQRPRTRHKEEKTTYAPVKLQPSEDTCVCYMANIGPENSSREGSSIRREERNPGPSAQPSLENPMP